MEPIVGLEWLIDHRDEVVVCDVRSYLDGRNGRDAYDVGHLPGARFIDLETELSDIGEPALGRHPLPTPDGFAAAMGRHGIGPDTAVVAYDDAGGMIAARLVWMLRVHGQDAALLDGGIDAWTGALTTVVPDVEPVAHPPRPWPPDRIVDADEVAAHIAAGGRVVDSRAGARYRGEVEPIDAAAGHVPGAINLPFADNLVDGAFRPVDALAERFREAGVDSDTIVYCGSGVSACNNLLAAEAAGAGTPKLYVGSWSGWSAQGRPVATGAD